MKDIPQNIYPDHALIVALYVFVNFKRFSDAISLQENGDCPALVSSDKIPGSSNGVWTCYRMLKHIKEKNLV